MTLNDIDKQFDGRFGLNDGYKVCMTYEDERDQDVSCELKQFIHQIYTQAKAEQREEDAKVVEGMKVKDNYGMISPDYGFNCACDDIAQAIRGAK